MSDAKSIPFSFVSTPNLHLATMLGTAGCKPLQIAKGPERTSTGVPQVKWLYEDNRAAEEIMAMWKNPNTKAKAWEQLTKDEKDIVVNFVTAFAANLKHYLGHTKTK